eukprot:NODE_6357_length_1679_cov_6.835052.p1 GENE.NODE_6357_length_1679_cov_6.835052~~NODE_6357_length_1679_cov_6.835052.p1  ORF type:complete len:459 (+),score=150.16 NODE_6357_length_1679_cov_6.835052:232-1608(+)
MQVAQEEQARDLVAEASVEHREALRSTQHELVELRGELAEAQASVGRCDGELQRRGERERAVRSELQRREAWLSSAANELDGFKAVEEGLARVRANTTETCAQFVTEELEAEQAVAAGNIAEAAFANAQRRLTERTAKLEEAERTHAVLLAELAVTESESSLLQASAEQLKGDEVAGRGARRGLESEMQRLAIEADALRAEKNEDLADHAEAEQRLRVVVPALMETRRRVHELEEDLAASRAGVARERELGGRLEREAALCRERARQLGDRNARLAEECAELEEQFAEASSWRRSQAVSSHAPSSPRGSCARTTPRGGGGGGRGGGGAGSRAGSRGSVVSASAKASRARPPRGAGSRICESPRMVLGTGRGGSTHAAGRRHGRSASAPTPSHVAASLVALPPPPPSPAAPPLPMPAVPAHPPPAMPASAVTQDLQYLQQWILGEEERLERLAATPCPD